MSLFERLGRFRFDDQRPAPARPPAVAAARLRTLREEAGKLEARLADPDFRAKAPPAVVEKNQARLAELRADLERLSSAH